MCRWRELPDLYSHSRQPGDRRVGRPAELARAEGCWGEQGMRKLWDASNVKIFAGGGSATCASSKAFPS